jgi:hypothetical protein
MTRECHVRFCKRLGAKLLRPTYQPAKSNGFLWITFSLDASQPLYKPDNEQTGDSSGSHSC